MLDLQGLKVELDLDAGRVRAIDNLCLTLRRGQTFALVGESGCGKSMTTLALMRLLPEVGRIEAGALRLEGANLFELPEARMREVRGGRVGMIFQEPSTSLNPVMRIGDQIVEAIETHTPLRGAAARAKALEWLQRVGIPAPERRLDDYPFRLSGGQKQRVMIAIALASEPDYLIADEPTTALDVTIQAQILELLASLQRERQLGVLLITHDLAVVSRMAHWVGLMYAGELVEVASAPAFFAAPRHPYARALLAALPDAERRGASLAAIPGTVPPLGTSFKGCRFAERCDRVLPACRTSAVPLQPAAVDHQVRCLLSASAPSSAASAARAPAELEVRPPAAAAAPLLKVSDLWVDYGRPQRGASQGESAVVRGVGFSVHAGQTLALVGESGSGKTTTGKAIAQLLRRHARVSGRAEMAGQNLMALEGSALMHARRDLQFIFQDPFASLNPRLRVQELLEEGLMALRPELDATQRQQRLNQTLDQVGLRRDSLARWPHEFSGGQRQRIAIARALLVEPRLIICDEPTSALDVSVQAQILNLLRDLQRERGLAYLFITHNLGVVEYLADEVVVMQHGCVVEAGPQQQVLSSPEQPYTRELLAAVLRVPDGLSNLA